MRGGDGLRADGARIYRARPKPETAPAPVTRPPGTMLRSALPLLLALAACAAPRATVPPPVPPPPAAAPAEPAPPAIAVGASVWNRDPGAALLGETSGTTLPFLFMRLEVLEAEGGRLRVRCARCEGYPEGWISEDAVVHRPLAPREAARLELADFALAVRHAALARDVEALRPVMARQFSHQLGPLEPGTLETFAAWEREGYRTLDRLPFLLDRGIATVHGTAVWAAPPEFTTTLEYADLRAGFRRGPDGWEWLFLVRDGL